MTEIKISITHLIIGLGSLFLLCLSLPAKRWMSRWFSTLKVNAEIKQEREIQLRKEKTIKAKERIKREDEKRRQKLNALYPGSWQKLREDLNNLGYTALRLEALKNFLSPYIKFAAKGAWTVVRQKPSDCPPMISPEAAFQLFTDYFSGGQREEAAKFITPFIQLTALTPKSQRAENDYRSGIFPLISQKGQESSSPRRTGRLQKKKLNYPPLGK